MAATYENEKPMWRYCESEYRHVRLGLKGDPCTMQGFLELCGAPLGENLYSAQALEPR